MRSMQRTHNDRRIDNVQEDPIANVSMKTLLSSHSSIYNALTNPELDFPMQGEAESRVSPDLRDQFSMNSWQIISNESVSERFGPKAPKSASVLSSMTDEEDKEGDDSVMMVSKQGKGSVMVFETDEEDEDNTEDEDRTLRSDFVPKKLKMYPNVLIMPKLSVCDMTSQSPINIQIAVLSSSQVFFRKETTELVQHLEEIFRYSKVFMKHFIIRNDVLGPIKDFIKQSDLIFVINDGSQVFVDCLKETYDGSPSEAEDLPPKLTIINMITVNYFINLFDLINFSKPFQIWKTSSLRQEKLLSSLKDFIELECTKNNEDDYSNEFKNVLTKRNSNLSMTVHDKSVYSTFFSGQKSDYKMIERSIRHELQQTTIIESIDPLNLNGSFSSMRICASIIGNILNMDVSGRTKVGIYCCMSVAVGLGIGIYKLNLGILDFLYKGDSAAVGQVINIRAKGDVLDDFLDIFDKSVSYMLIATENLVDYLKKVITPEYLTSLVELNETCTRNFQGACVSIMECLKDGLQKIFSAFPII